MIKRKISAQRLSDITKGAFNIAFNEIIRNHPRLRGLENYIASNLDIRKINSSIAGKYHAGEPDNAIIEEIANSISSLEYLDEKVKKRLLKEGLKENEEKYSLRTKLLHPVAFLRRKTIDDKITKIFNAASEITYFAKSTGQYEALPQDTRNALETMGQYNLKSTINDILLDYHLGGIKSLYQKAKTKKELEKQLKTVKSYSQKFEAAGVAAAVLLIASFLLLGFSAGHMTGFVIAGNKIPSGYPIGAGFILLIIALCFSFLRKKKKQVKRKVRKRKK